MKFALLLAAAGAMLCAAPLGLGALRAHAAPDAAAPKGDPARGHKLFVATGCYQCHGYEGATAGPGPRLAPDPEPYDEFTAQLRRPRAKMPIYTAAVMPDQDVADIYAYLRAQPKAKPVADIPLLNP